MVRSAKVYDNRRQKYINNKNMTLRSVPLLALLPQDKILMQKLSLRKT